MGFSKMHLTKIRIKSRRLARSFIYTNETIDYFLRIIKGRQIFICPDKSRCSRTSVETLCQAVYFNICLVKKNLGNVKFG